MTDPRRVSTRRAVLSYSQVKQLTQWPDLLVKDYQGILQDFAYLADETDALELRVEINEADIDELQQKVEDLEARTLRVISTTFSLIAESFKIVLCNNSTPITITLNPVAVKDDMIHVMRKNASVDVIGTINGLTDRTINVVNYSELYIYDGSEWSTI
jgi:hypothetical protein